MRYRLRTLLIVLAVICVILARIAYVKEQRDFHRHEVQKLVSQLASIPGSEAERVLARQVHEIAASGPAARGSWIGSSGLPGECGSPEYESTITAWYMVRQHEILVSRYDHALYRPWMRVWDDPNSVPDSVRFVDFRLGTMLTVVAILVLAACRMAWGSWSLAAPPAIQHRSPPCSDSRSATCCG